MVVGSGTYTHGSPLLESGDLRYAAAEHLSVKTLRYCHEVGLLEPTVVDLDSGGYRYYQPGQAHLVRRFRDLGLPVADVKAVLTAPT
jgi:DNA-binding transcriptional MerR regulator